MNMKEYQELANKTNTPKVDSIIERFSNEKNVNLMHASMGLNTEASEFTDMLKKSIYYGKPLDEVNLLEELGDLMWYTALALTALNSDFETIMKMNIEKLSKRYPNLEFSEDKAINRDIDVERKTLEDNV